MEEIRSYTIEELENPETKANAASEFSVLYMRMEQNTGSHPGTTNCGVFSLFDGFSKTSSNLDESDIKAACLL